MRATGNGPTPTGEQLLQRLEDEERALLQRCGEAAAARRESAFLVGGSVRDLMLDVRQTDLDVVVEGDGLAVAQAVARGVAGELTRHHAFQTARVQTPGGIRLDVATARSEEYPAPGRLPLVVAGPLRDDLERRDFTINTMAIALNPDTLGELIDPLDGASDLRAGRIRVMHRRSFADDPTRVLRALRFALRFGYEIDLTTQEWLEDAVRGGYLDSVSADRVRRELAATFEETPVDGPLRLAREGVLAAIDPGLGADREALEELQRLRDWYGAVEARQTAGPADAVGRSWALVLACCADGMSAQGRWRLVRRLALSRTDRAPLIDAGARLRNALPRISAADGEAAPSVIEGSLRGTSPGALLVSAATADDSARRAVLRYLEELRWVRPALGGGELAEMGVEPGPEIGEILEILRAARLDGKVDDEAGERRFVAALLGEKPRG